MSRTRNPHLHHADVSEPPLQDCAQDAPPQEETDKNREFRFDLNVPESLGTYEEWTRWASDEHIARQLAELGDPRFGL